MTMPIKIGDLKRYQLSKIIRRYTKSNSLKLGWAELCKHTEFDSFATALAFGMSWKDENIKTMPIAHLRMAAFNMKFFPKVVE